MWQPIATLPSSGQALVTDDDPDDGDGYGTIELIVCLMLSDGRVLNQMTGAMCGGSKLLWHYS